MRVRIAITGIGAICSTARDSDDFTAALREARRGFSPLTDPRLSRLRATRAATIPDLEPAESEHPEVRPLDRNVHLALRAAREALSRSGLGDRPLGARAGVVLGTCSGGMLSIERHYEALSRGEEVLDEDLAFSKRYYTTAKVLAWATGARGPALSVVTACAAGAGAVAQAADLLRAGLVDVALAGGSDAFSPSTLVGFDALKATCEGTCAPFSTPVGLNLGEGAAFLVLESLEHARRRGATVLAELLGTGLSNDAHHPTAPDPSARGQLAAMRAALDDAGVTAEEIDYLNAHGTGTRANDPAESRAVLRLFGERTRQLPISSTKSMIGHCLGGAGALEASATVLAARAGFTPPTAGFSEPREGCAELDCVPDPGRPWRGRLALSNSFGFAGNNACLVLDVDPDPHRRAAPAPEPADARAVISGLGMVTALGLGTEPFGALDERSRGISELRRIPTPASGFRAGTIPEIDPRRVDRRLDLRGLDDCSRYTALAARSALSRAGLRPRPAVMAKVGMVLGIAGGPGRGEAEHLRATFENDFAIPSLGAFPYVVPNEVAGNVARALMLKGHNTVLAAGIGAGLAALGSATIAVEQGHGELVVAAGADELSERSLADGYRLGLWGPGTGVTPGEGAAALLVESLRSARDRGAEPLAEVLGFAGITDAGHPRRGGGEAAAARALERALERAGARPDEVDAIAARPGAARRAALEVLGDRAAIHSLEPRIGLAEAAGPLVDLGHLLAARAGSLLAACSISPEGLGLAVVLRAPGGGSCL
ncbi:MAG: beta-ketoacyl-[acyl-carrier-protein] synthase family protein [Polyangia bacterium]